MSTGDKSPRDIALPIAQRLAALLMPACDWLQIAGSLRRGKSEVGDIELVATPKIVSGQNALWWLLAALLEEGSITKTLITDKNGREYTRWGEKYRTLTFQDVKVDIFLCDEQNRGYQYWLRTGPGEANEWLAKAAKGSSPFTLRGGYFWYGEQKLTVPDEATLFRLFGMPFIPPAQRTAEAYKTHLNKTHAWGEVMTCLPPPASPAPQQATMKGFGVREWFTEKEEAAAASQQAVPPVDRWDWKAPWLHEATGKVWISNGWIDGKRHFILIDKDSPAGEKARLFLERSSVYLFGSYTDELLKFLYSRQTLYFPDVVDIGELPALSSLPTAGEHRTETVAIERIVPTQRGVNRWTVWEYETTNPTRRDARNNLPFGIRFAGSATIYLTDGHHRLMADRIRHRRQFALDVQDYTCTFEQACGLIEEDDGDEFLADVLEEVMAILESEAVYG